MSVDVYPPAVTPEYWSEVRAGRVPGVSVVGKFGRNSAVGTAYAPVAIGAVYQTPQVSSATTLRVKAGNTNDTAAGSGAREVTLKGLDETGAEVEETLATAGTSASSTTSATFIRLYRVYVSASGTYATSAAGSHSADITIENGSGGTDWATVAATDFARSQSEIAVYTVPLGKTACVLSVDITVDSNKTADVLFFHREGVLQTAPPYSAMRMIFEAVGIIGEVSHHHVAPLGPYPALTDLGFMARAATSAEVNVDFEIALFDT